MSISARKRRHEKIKMKKTLTSPRALATTFLLEMEEIAVTTRTAVLLLAVAALAERKEQAWRRI